MKIFIDILITDELSDKKYSPTSKELSLFSKNNLNTQILSIPLKIWNIKQDMSQQSYYVSGVLHSLWLNKQKKTQPCAG